MRTHKLRSWVVWMSALTLFAVACGGAAEDGGDTAAGGSPGTAGEGELAGSTVTVLAAFVSEEGEAFEETLRPFEEETGVEVDFEGIQGFDTLITTRIQGGQIPNIAIFPQPGLLLDIVEQTDALPLSEYLDIDEVEAAMIPGFLDATTTEDGNAYGLPMRMAVKSVVWYPVPEFEEAGYEIPTTQDELDALEEQILEDGNTPWCLGMESGDATGWVGTDWVEEYMLRLHGPEVYDAWVANELPFDSEEVRAAFEAFGDIWMPEGNVLGGARALTAVPFGDAPNAMFDEQPGCYLHRQGNFITGFFPDEVQEDLPSNVGAFYFPPSSDGFDGDPVLAGGDLALLIDDSPAARALMEFLASEEYGESWAAQGGWLSPNVNFDPSVYPDEVTASVFEIAAGADVLRFDASDLMPGAVGTGTFWTGIIDWVSGRSDLDAVLTNIQNSWPASN